MTTDPTRVPKRPRDDGTDAAADAPPQDPLTAVADPDQFLVLLQSYYSSSLRFFQLAHTLVSFAEKIYPFQLVFDWLSYGDASAMRSREISYTKEPEIYVRYKTFQTAEEFRNDVRASNNVLRSHLRCVSSFCGLVHAVRP